MKRHLLSLALCAIALPAYAQIGPSVGGPGGGYGAGAGGSGLANRGGSHGSQDDDASKKDDKPVAPPPAIPGAQPDANASVIPADKVAAEMSPNDALFDAINRGDLGAAKDAVNRGAQLDSHNVLGQTPTDAAIDLSRNDITFLLLSMRSSVSNGNKPVQVAAVPGKPGRAKRALGPAQRVPVHVAAADRGTPNPAVGFNGF